MKEEIERKENEFVGKTIKIENLTGTITEIERIDWVTGKLRRILVKKSKELLTVKEWNEAYGHRIDWVTGKLRRIYVSTRSPMMRSFILPIGDIRVILE